MSFEVGEHLLDRWNESSDLKRVSDMLTLYLETWWVVTRVVLACFWVPFAKKFSKRSSSVISQSVGTFSYFTSEHQLIELYRLFILCELQRDNAAHLFPFYIHSRMLSRKKFGTIENISQSLYVCPCSTPGSFVISPFIDIDHEILNY